LCDLVARRPIQNSSIALTAALVLLLDGLVAEAQTGR
jgi:hypothetical protein